MKVWAFPIFTLLCLLWCVVGSPVDALEASLKSLLAERELRGIQLQVSRNSELVANVNLGSKNEQNQRIGNSTMFRVASLSKGVASAGIMLLVEQGKLRLNSSLSEVLGFKVENPYFPGKQITIEMILSHQSSLLECQPFYTNFLMDTYNAKDGFQVPALQEILRKGGSYYSECLFSKTHRPGTYFQYVNLNFGIAGTIIQKVSNMRFDEFQRQFILAPLSKGLDQVSTFNPSRVQNSKNLGTIFKGDKGKWVPAYDYYPDGVIPARNLTGYTLGKNGLIYGPQGSLRASASHLTKFALMLLGEGKAPSGQNILLPLSAKQLLRWRYQYSGPERGPQNDFHAYGLGFYGTTYRKNDIIFSHKVVRGHLGAAYNLISGMHFWDNFTLTYIVNGALNGYKYGTGTIYEYQRLSIHKAVEEFVQGISADPESSPQHLE